ncbi:hypothetical protein ACTFIR_009361 [Dictyostelium discoideum]
MEPLNYVNSADEKSLHDEGISTPITSTKKRCISTKATSPPKSQSTHIINTEMNEDEEIEEINTFEDTASNGNEESGNGNEEIGTENEEEGNEHEDAGEETEEAGDEESLLDLPFSSVLDRDLTQKISSISATMEEKRDYIFYIYFRKTLEDSLNNEKLKELITTTKRSTTRKQYYIDRVKNNGSTNTTLRTLLKKMGIEICYGKTFNYNYYVKTDTTKL